MKILWVKSDFLHPTTRGGQIRTLEMLKCLHRRHEIHYVAFDDGTNPEGQAKSPEYCAHAYPVHHIVPPRRSIRFAGQLLRGLVSPLPVAVQRYKSRKMRNEVELLLKKQNFNSIVCDFLFPAPNIPDLSRCVLFQHNVESVIWQRHTERAANPLARAYFRLQARRMHKFEGAVCRAAGHVIGVSEVDREIMRSQFKTDRVSAVQTGVNLDYFAPSPHSDRKADLVFVGSMDWLPNIDGVQYFLNDILPLIRKQRSDCRVAIAGRKPSPALLDAAKRDPHLIVTGTVPDIRPFLWGSTISIVPLRIGGGTRLKIFEAIAARLPVVSTTVGAEGLPLKDGTHIRIADDPQRFATACVDLLNNVEARRTIVDNAFDFVSTHFSWDAVTRDFERILEAGPSPNELCR